MKKLEKKQKILIAQLVECKDMMKGSIAELCSSCTRTKCICKTKSQTKTYRLTYKDKEQKSRIVYVPKDMLEDVKYRLDQFEKARQIIDDLIKNNIEIFKLSSKN